MRRVLLVTLLSAVYAAAQDDGADSGSRSDPRTGPGRFTPLSADQKALALQAARQVQLLKEAQRACAEEISDTLTDAQRADLARDREAAFVKNTGPRVDAPAALKELTRLGLAVSNGAAGVSFGLTASALPRAFSTGTGLVLVTTGLVKKCANEAQLAAVLAHELDHVRRRADEAPRVRSLRAQCQSLKAMKELMPQVDVTASAAMASGVLGGVELLLRDGEDEADVAALRALGAAGYDPAEYEALVRALGDTNQDGWTSPGSAERRAAKLQRRREELGLTGRRKPPLPKALAGL